MRRFGIALAPSKDRRSPISQQKPRAFYGLAERRMRLSHPLRAGETITLSEKMKRGRPMPIRAERGAIPLTK